MIRSGNPGWNRPRRSGQGAGSAGIRVRRDAHRAQGRCGGMARRREGKGRSRRLAGPFRGPGAGRRPGRGPSSGPRRDRLHFFPCREAAGGLLRVDEISVERDLEHTAGTLDQLDLGAVDPGEPVAHTERFGFIPSSTAILDSELHRRSPAKPPVRDASIHPGRSIGHLETPCRAAGPRPGQGGPGGFANRDENG